MTNNHPSTDSKKFAGWLSPLAWIAVGLLSLNIAVDMGERTLTLDWNEDGPLAVINAFGLAAVQHLPSFAIIAALWDFANLFQRCAHGQVFTQRNFKTLRSGGDSLVFAGVASAIISPTLTMWIGEEFRGLIVDLNDLALGVGMMGLVIIGLALIFHDALRLKEENDEFV